MENRQYSAFASQSAQLFYIYDTEGIGEITKSTLLSYFATIDPQINQQWLNKILLEQGTCLKEYIDCKQFIRIMEAINSISEQATASQFQELDL